MAKFVDQTTGEMPLVLNKFKKFERIKIGLNPLN